MYNIGETPPDYPWGIFSLAREKVPNLNAALKAIVDKVNQSALKTIYTYVGDDNNSPIYYEETLLFKKMLENVGITAKVVEVTDQILFPEEWDPVTALLHVPGAESSKLDEHIGAKIPDIKRFVESGGSFIGWCGGAYWACREVKYRINETETMHKIRNLAFWKGVEEGPLIPFLGNPEGNIGFFHGAVKVNWSGTETLREHLPDGIKVQALLSGGGSFIPSEGEYPHKVLGRYTDFKDQVAAVKTFVGNGVSVLLNPYFTHGDDYFRSGLEGYKRHFPSHPWDQIVYDLTGNNLERNICFADMILDATIKEKT